MSIIYSIVCIFFFASTISATVQRPAPPVVYSAVIHNEQNAPIQCHVVWSEASGGLQKSQLFTVEKLHKYIVDEKLESMGSWEARSVIEEIHCGTLVLKAPFDGVKSPKLAWNFFVQTDKIVSGRSNSRVENY